MKRIEIAGNIASGKTTATKILNKLGFHCIYEDFKAVPFWRKYYENPNAYSYETEISFLIQHYHQIKVANTNNILVCDYSFLNDLAYAKLGLSDKRQDIFGMFLDDVLLEIGEPIFTIKLTTPIDVLKNRIIERKREVESNITEGFLQNLENKITISNKYKTPMISLSNNDTVFDLENSIYSVIKTYEESTSDFIMQRGF